MKYNVMFCKCGRVHFIDEEKINEAIKNNKQVLVICNNCGESLIIGANESYEESGDKCYMMYSSNMIDTEINDTSKIHSIVFSAGEQIQMMTGGAATYYGNNTFIDWETKKPEDVSNEEWEKLRETVHTQHTINWIRDEDKLEQLSHYGSGIDWTGTKYKKDYN